jgi:tRNA splicing endonuclease
MKIEDVYKEAKDHLENSHSASDDTDSLRREVFVLRKTLEEYGAEQYSILSDIEYICSKGISDLKKISETTGLTLDDTKTLDLLHKNLRAARGKLNMKESKHKLKSVDDLLKLVDGDNK